MSERIAEEETMNLNMVGLSIWSKVFDSWFILLSWILAPSNCTHAYNCCLQKSRLHVLKSPLLLTENICKTFSMHLCPSNSNFDLCNKCIIQFWGLSIGIYAGWFCLHGLLKSTWHLPMAQQQYRTSLFTELRSI